MGLLTEVDRALHALRRAFTHRETFEWCSILTLGMLVRPRMAGVSAVVASVGLGPDQYRNALHFFRSKAVEPLRIARVWLDFLRDEHPHSPTLEDKPVFIADGIKVPKEGRRMPGVKRHHQESSNVKKPEYIVGHYFNVLAVLVGSLDQVRAACLRAEIHDGVVEPDEPDATILTRTAKMCIETMPEGSHVALDAGFCAKHFLATMRAANRHVITRARSNTLAHRPLEPAPAKRGRGRPREWGETVKLAELFESHASAFETTRAILYGREQTVRYLALELYWDNKVEPLRFVLTVTDDGRRAILVSTNMRLSAVQIITAYGWRFRIECSFRALVMLLWGFSYHFWTKSLPLASRRHPQRLELGELDEVAAQKARDTVAASERFVLLAGLALGVLQHLSLKMPEQVWSGFPTWFVSHAQQPSEEVTRLTLQHEWARISPRSRAGLLVAKMIDARLPAAGSTDDSYAIAA